MAEFISLKFCFILIFCFTLIFILLFVVSLRYFCSLCNFPFFFCLINKISILFSYLALFFLTSHLLGYFSGEYPHPNNHRCLLLHSSLCHSLRIVVFYILGHASNKKLSSLILIWK